MVILIPKLHSSVDKLPLIEKAPLINGRGQVGLLGGRTLRQSTAKS